VLGRWGVQDEAGTVFMGRITMFFYTALFVASLIAAFIIIWLYRSIADAGKAVYQAMLPSSRNAATSHLENQTVRTSVNDTPTPWGWKNHQTPAHLAKTHAALPTEKSPWGWKESQRANENRPLNGRAASQPATRNKQNVGWPYREEKSEFAGKAYKVRRHVRLKRTNLANTSKPWGW
jgi:hypothetical protein